MFSFMICDCPLVLLGIAFESATLDHFSEKTSRLDGMGNRVICTSRNPADIPSLKNHITHSHQPSLQADGTLCRPRPKGQKRDSALQVQLAPSLAQETSHGREERERGNQSTTRRSRERAFEREIEVVERERKLDNICVNSHNGTAGCVKGRKTKVE